jgi:hypothetical protein
LAIYRVVGAANKVFRSDFGMPLVR